MTQEQVYNQVIEGLEERVPVTTTLNNLNYPSSTFYRLLSSEQRTELSFYKALTSKQPPRKYGIPDSNDNILNNAEEYFRDEEYNY